jgi:type II secretory pathway component GspD/PulD (secretin)
VLRLSVSLLILLSCLYGCASTVDSQRDKELDALLETFNKYKDQRVEAKARKQAEGIRKLKIDKVNDNFQISVDLDSASLVRVVEKVLQETATPHSMDKDALHGKVSAAFDNLSVTDALKQLLAPFYFSVYSQNGILIIKNSLDSTTTDKGSDAKVEATPSPGTASKTPVTVEVLCRNTDVSKVLKSLGDFFPKDAKLSMRFSAVPNANAILLTGDPDEVKQAVNIIRRVDRKPKHVFIEAAVIEVDTNALVELGVDITNAARGEFSAINTAFGSLTDTALTFTWAKMANPPALTAAINFLVSKGRARVITRPYIATESGEKATITITNDRYVIVQTSVAGATVSTTVPVSSGAILEITPKVISDKSVLMQVAVEDSEFVPPSQNVAVEVDKNKASTIMQVESGETIIIGGLILDRHSKDDSGFPFLKDVPGLNLLFGKQADSNSKQETMIFLTPHIWEPDISSPVIAPQKSLITGD